MSSSRPVSAQIIHESTFTFVTPGTAAGSRQFAFNASCRHGVSEQPLPHAWRVWRLMISVAGFAAFGRTDLVLVPPPSLEVVAADFAGAFEPLPGAFGAFFLGALEDTLAPFCEDPLGIKSPTGRTALDPASTTDSAAEVAASPIRSSTPFDLFLLGIGCSLRWLCALRVVSQIRCQPSRDHSAVGIDATPRDDSLKRKDVK